MRALADINDVAHAIQLAVAPVFLLTAVGAFLSVMTNRLARVIDRARSLEGRLEEAGPDTIPPLKEHLRVLSRRARYINIAITACTITALLVCAVIAIIFFGSYADIDTKVTVPLIFIFAMMSLMIGLLCFLQEVFLATLNLRIGPK